MPGRTGSPVASALEEIKRRQEYKKIVCDGTVTRPDIDISLGRQLPARPHGIAQPRRLVNRTGKEA